MDNIDDCMILLDAALSSMEMAKAALESCKDALRAATPED